MLSKIQLYSFRNDEIIFVSFNNESKVKAVKKKGLKLFDFNNDPFTYVYKTGSNIIIILL